MFQGVNAAEISPAYYEQLGGEAMCDGLVNVSSEVTFQHAAVTAPLVSG